jgi:hypothetical protein
VESLKYLCARVVTTLTFIALFPFARAIVAYDRLRWERAPDIEAGLHPHRP